jgi:hypothetical protein
MTGAWLSRWGFEHRSGRQDATPYGRQDACRYALAVTGCALAPFFAARLRGVCYTAYQKA